jgi:hypothetical protein
MTLACMSMHVWYLRCTTLQPDAIQAMPDTSLPHDPHAEDADGHALVGEVIELSLLPLAEPVHSEPSRDASPMLEWQADDVDWMTLRTARYSRAWRLAALALGLKPAKDIRRRLSGLGRQAEERAYLAMKSVIANNLTSEADPDRLSFVKDAENDGRRLDPNKKSTERLLDVVVFVDFIQSRGVNVHPRMAGIVQEIAELKAANAEGSVAFDLEQAPSGEASSSKESLTIGLLMMYLRDLTKRRAAPPPGLLKGANDDINAQELAATLQAFVSERIDRDGRHAMPTTGASITTLRKTLGAAKRHFDAISDE